MFSKPNAIVYVRRNDLIIGGKHINAGKLKLPIEIVNNLEILDPDSFIDLCQDFFSSHNLKGKRALVILDQSIIFSKLIELNSSNKNDLDLYIDNYIDQMPYLPSQRSVIKYKDNEKFKIYATNADIYQAVVDSLKLCGISKIVSISPSSAYTIDFSLKSSEIIDQFMIDKKVWKTYDFSTTSSV